jgi:hypothetical protein
MLNQENNTIPNKIQKIASGHDQLHETNHNESNACGCCATPSTLALQKKRKTSDQHKNKIANS